MDVPGWIDIGAEEPVVQSAVEIAVLQHWRTVVGHQLRLGHGHGACATAVEQRQLDRQLLQARCVGPGRRVECPLAELPAVVLVQYWPRLDTGALCRREQPFLTQRDAQLSPGCNALAQREQQPLPGADVDHLLHIHRRPRTQAQHRPRRRGVQAEHASTRRFGTAPEVKPGEAAQPGAQQRSDGVVVAQRQRVAPMGQPHAEILRRLRQPLLREPTEQHRGGGGRHGQRDGKAGQALARRRARLAGNRQRHHQRRGQQRGEPVARISHHHRVAGQYQQHRYRRPHGAAAKLEEGGHRHRRSH